MRPVVWISLLALASSHASAQAPAASWQEVWKQGDETDYLDAASVRGTQKGVEGWIKHLYTPAKDIEGQRVGMMWEKARYSKDHKWTLRVTFYRPDGQVIGTHINPDDPRNAGLELIPDTAEQIIAQKMWAAAQLPKSKSHKRGA